MYSFGPAVKGKCRSINLVLIYNQIIFNHFKPSKHVLCNVSVVAHQLWGIQHIITVAYALVEYKCVFMLCLIFSNNFQFFSSQNVDIKNILSK